MKGYDFKGLTGFRRKNNQDFDLQQREYYNPNKFPIVFEIMKDKIQYILQWKIKEGPHKVVLLPDSHLYLNHGYYVATAKGLPKGERFDLVVNFEKQMHIGNKQPSAFDI